MGNALSEYQQVDADTVVIGAGPTGLGAAYRLQQYKMRDWLLLDAEKSPGGLAGSVTTQEGFRFDHGFQTLTSNYEYFEKVLQSLEQRNKKMMREVRTNSAVVSNNKLIPYPIQHNIKSLPKNYKLSCATDLMAARLKKSLGCDDNQTVENLNDYLVAEWGESLTNLFFRPYIYKSWAYPPEKMTHEWIKRRIPQMGVEEMVGILLDDKEEEKEGEEIKDNTVKYPKTDGLAKLWESVIEDLSEDCVHFKTKIKSIDADNKVITTTKDIEVKYENLVSTIPLSLLLRLVGRTSGGEDFECSSSYVVCLGIRGETPLPQITGCIYFPESNVVFHRACVFSSFDQGSVPPSTQQLKTIRYAKEDREPGKKEEGGPYWSLMLEVTCGPLKKVNKDTIVEEVIQDACSINLLKDENEIVSMHLIQMSQNCPLPKVDGEKKVKDTLEWLQSKGIYSRGRCGAFSQKVMGIEDDFIQGVEVVDHILHGCPEHCLNSGTSSQADHKFCMPKFNLKRESISTAGFSSSFREDPEDETSSSSGSSSSDSSSLYSEDSDVQRSYTTTDSGLDSRED